MLQEFSCDLGSGRSGLCCPEVAASEARHLLTARRSEPAQPGLQLPAGLTDQDIKQRLDSRQTCGRGVTRQIICRHGSSNFVNNRIFREALLSIVSFNVL